MNFKKRIFATRNRVKKILGLVEKNTHDMENLKQVKTKVEEIERKIEGLKGQSEEIKEQNKKLQNKMNYFESELRKVSKEKLFPKKSYETYWFEKFYAELETLDFKECYLNLIKNLDEESLSTVIKILTRMKCSIESEAESLTIFTADELKKIKRLSTEYLPSIIKISDDCYAYKDYLLPIKHFEASVFLYQHEISRLRTNHKIKEKDIVDVGGFIGDSALIFSKLTEKKVYSFEPTATNFENMLRTIELNQVSNIVPIFSGLGASQGHAVVNINGSASSILYNQFKKEEQEEVAITTLDKFVEENNLSVGLIKVDIEGYEQEFLKGAENVIRTQKPALIISIYHSAFDFFQIKPIIESWDLGYKIQIVKPVDGQVLLETILLAEVES